MSDNLEALEAELSELETSITEQTSEEAADEEQEKEEPKQEASAEDAESSESKGETTDDEGKEEWLVPGQFKTSDDLIQSYKEIRAYATRTAQELSVAKQMKTSPELDPSEKEARIVEFAEAIKKDPIKAIEQIVEGRLSERDHISKKQNFANVFEKRMQDKTFAELEPVMSEIAQGMGDLIKDPQDPRVLDALYMMAKAKVADKSVEKAAAKATKEAESREARKRKATVEGGSSTKGAQNIDPYKMSMAELEAEIAGQA